MLLQTRLRFFRTERIVAQFLLRSILEPPDASVSIKTNSNVQSNDPNVTGNFEVIIRSGSAVPGHHQCLQAQQIRLLVCGGRGFWLFERQQSTFRAPPTRQR